MQKTNNCPPGALLGFTQVAARAYETLRLDHASKDLERRQSTDKLGRNNGS